MRHNVICICHAQGPIGLYLRNKHSSSTYFRKDFQMLLAVNICHVQHIAHYVTHSNKKAENNINLKNSKHLTTKFAAHLLLYTCTYEGNYWMRCLVSSFEVMSHCC